MRNKHSIPLDQAIDMTRRYREQKDNIVKPEYINLLPLSETFDKSAFAELTAEPGCISIRCYLGMDEDLEIRLIFVAADANDDDILPPEEGASIMENGNHCPPICPGGSSPLNS